MAVWSAYKLYVRRRDGSQPSSSNGSDSDQYWKSIWKLPCLPKMQQFACRLVHNGLRLMTCIKRRGMDCETRCVCCRRLDEDKAHLFFKCKKMKKEWERLEMETIRECSCSCQSAHAVIEELPLLTENEKCKVCCSIWRWWTRRNKINAKEPAISFAEVF
jgi:hypothetical protein